MILDRLEVGHAFAFRPEYRRFVERAKAVSLRATPKKLAGERDWVRHVAEVFTVEEIERDYGDLTSWDVRLLRFAYPIARTYSGDAIVQVAAGKHAGKIVMTDHETYHGFFDVLATFTPSPAQERFLASEGAALKKLGFIPSFVTADQVIGLALGGDGGQLVADSLEEFLDALKETRGLTAETRATASTPTLGWRKVGKLADVTRATTLDDALVFGGGPSGLHIGRDPRALERIKYVTADGLAAGRGVLWVVDGNAVSWSRDGGRTFTRAAIEGKKSVLLPTGVVADPAGRCWVSWLGVVASGTAGGTLRPLALADGGTLVMPTVLCATRNGVAVADGLRLLLAREDQLHGTALTSTTIQQALETSAGTLLALDEYCGIHRSDDGGATWTAAKRPDPDSDARAVISAMANVGSSVVVAADLVMVSHDDGRTFDPVREKLPQMRCGTSLAERGYLIGTDGSLWEVSLGAPGAVVASKRPSKPASKPAKVGRKGSSGRRR